MSLRYTRWPGATAAALSGKRIGPSNWRRDQGLSNRGARHNPFACCSPICPLQEAIMRPLWQGPPVRCVSATVSPKRHHNHPGLLDLISLTAEDDLVRGHRDVRTAPFFGGLSSLAATGPTKGGSKPTDRLLLGLPVQHLEKGTFVMKKALYGTTALVAAVVVAGQADAASGLKLGITGFYRGAVGLTFGDSNTGTFFSNPNSGIGAGQSGRNNVTFRQEVRVNFTGSTDRKSTRL